MGLVANAGGVVVHGRRQLPVQRPAREKRAAAFLVQPFNITINKSFRSMQLCFDFTQPHETLLAAAASMRCRLTGDGHFLGCSQADHFKSCVA